MPVADKILTPRRLGLNRARRRLRAALLALAATSAPAAFASTTFTETFTGTTASGWVFGANPGDTPPVLTANTIDAPGNGWLRLNTNTTEQSTYALLDTQIFSINAKIEIEMDFAFFNGTGADGITFFLVDGSQDSSSFSPGAYGGSMGYAQRTGEAGMAGGYLGFALDTFGNYSNDDEGRTGGYASGLRPNNVVVRGPESSNWAFIDDSGDLGSVDFNGAAPGGTGQNMAFYGSTTRPDQTGANYRSFRIILDANNQLAVEMRFGVGNDYVQVFTSDLSAFERPETFKIGFTGATGGSTGIHEIRNLSLTSTPWASGSGAYEWDNGAATTTWGTTAGTETNANWFSSISGDNNKTPTPGSDILFGNKPASGPQTVNVANNVSVRNLTFDTPYDYTLQGAGVITLGKDADGKGLPSINVNNYNGADAVGRHKINNDLTVLENLAIRNFSYSTLCLNGDIDFGSRTITTSGYGLTNFNGQLTGSGALVINGATSNPATGQGIVTVSGDNASSFTGTITVNNGQLVALSNGALGNTAAGTTVNDGGTLTFRGGITTAENLTLRGAGATLGRGDSLAFTRQAGALYNDGGDNTVSGSITLAADAAVGSRAGNLTLAGVISGSGRSLTKLGEGVVTLSGNNTYSGPTRIEGGALRVTSSGALNSSSNFVLAGGVLEIGADLNGGTAGDYSQSLGTGGNNLRWDGDGGFSAHGGDRTVRLNNGTGALTWASTNNFVGADSALLLSSASSDSTLTLANELRLNNAQREIRVADGSAAVDAVLSGRVQGGGNNTGTGGIIKTGEGTLSLTAGNNRYGGATEIRAGAIRGSLGSNSNIQLQGGVRELNANYTGNLGTGGGALRWLAGGGGLAADTTARTFNVGGDGQALIWGGTTGTNNPHFVRAGDELVLGSRSTSATLTFANAINLNNGERTIRVLDGVAASSTPEAVISGAISNGSLAVTGNGRLDLTAANTYTGTTTIVGSEVRLRDSGSLATTAGTITVRQGGALTLDNSGTANLGDRVTSGVTLAGGTLNFLGAAAASSETIGTVTLSSGANTINVQRNGTNSSQLDAASLSRTAGSAATVDFTNTAGGGTLGTTGANPRVLFTAAPTLDDGILAYATVNGTAFATHGANGIAAASTDTGTWEANKNIGLTADGILGFDTNRQVNSVNVSNGALMDFNGRNVDVQSGGLLAHGASATSFTGGGTLTSSSGELITHVYGAGGFTIEQAITNSGSTPVAFTKSGDGVLTLSGTTANTFTGATTVNAGTLALAKSDGVTALSSTSVTVGDGRGIDTLRLNANEQINNAATVTLRGGEVGNAANVARLELNGATSESFGSRVESFATLSITGNSVVDFGGGTPCSPTFLYLDLLSVASDSLLTITNWIEFTDFFLVDKTAFDPTQLARVIFDGYGGSASWKTYDSDYYQIVPYSPVPEPATYGLLALGGLLGSTLLRRKKRPASV